MVVASRYYSLVIALDGRHVEIAVGEGEILYLHTHYRGALPQLDAGKNYLLVFTITA